MSIVMKEMYQLQSSPSSSMRKWDKEHRVDKSKRWRTLRYTYLLLMILSFCLEVHTIFVATQVLTQLATAQSVVPHEIDLGDKDTVGGLFSMMATTQEVHQSMIEFLIKNFEFEYATVRLHFVTGLLSFTVAQALRVRYALRKYKELSLSAMCCLLCVATGMLTYTNANTITYGGYLGLLRRQLFLSYKFLTNRISSGPLSAGKFMYCVLTRQKIMLLCIRLQTHLSLHSHCHSWRSCREICNTRHAFTWVWIFRGRHCGSGRGQQQLVE